MFTVDEIKKRTNGNNGYLGLRFFVYLIMTIISIQSIYDVENVTSRTYFNNTLLFSTPLFIEYMFGLKCYSDNAKKCKTFGFIVSAFIFIISIFGLTGISNIELDKNSFKIIELYLYKGHISILILMQIAPFISCICALGDWCLAYTNEEVRFYNLTSEINECIEDLITKDKLDVLEKAKEGYKEKYRNKVLESIKGNS
ncbi:Uncharacterised protein [[Clostridium] sordellii]|uniref:hypothetical protein n=1 Tax=Paraclostridium sordellii TaxID=1505 RepID=UPI0005E266CF|nr:hypothetical protein [Paeniclostridium sordellii]CEN23736.1 Uncharacterised protein [[Clostridium] sordellii] [Paeniclostridium sordellii]